MQRLAGNVVAHRLSHVAWGVCHMEVACKDCLFIMSCVLVVEFGARSLKLLLSPRSCCQVAEAAVVSLKLLSLSLSVVKSLKLS